MQNPAVIESVVVDTSYMIPIVMRIARLLSSNGYMAFPHEVYANDSVPRAKQKRGEQGGEELLFRDILK